MIEVREVRKRFGEVRAVDGLSFAAYPNEIFGLIGPNGAGKTTTIRMIMNILAPDSGEILFDGRRISEADKARIGYLPEERGLYRKITVNDMLLYLATLKGASRSVSQDRIDGWLRKFELIDWKDKEIHQLSKGMSQKIQFIGAVAHDPPILFFDEPFSGLDPVSTDLLRNAILEMRDQGKTVLFSTHIMEQAERLCNRILLVNQGRELISGSLDEVKSRYGTRTVVVEYDGDGHVLDDLPQADAVTRYPRWVEIQLADGANADDVLAALVGRLSIRRFELVSPSLHRIFVENVTAGEDHEQAV
jgi:ABC-2 type transport system ATP-binding protein